MLFRSTAYASATVNAATAYASSVSSASSLYLPKAGGTVSGDLTITGSITVSGTTSYVNTQNLLIGDNILTLNADIPGSVAPSENAGIEVNRGNKNSNAALIWNETAQLWMFSSNTQTAYTTAIASNTDLVTATVAANTFAQGNSATA